MKTIWKYILMDNHSILRMPLDAKILDVQFQRDSLCIWAIVDTEKDDENRIFVVKATGTPLTEDIQTLKFIGTLQRGIYVWHVFEVNK